MKLITFTAPDGREHIGCMHPQDPASIIDFTAADDSASFRDMLALIDAGPQGLDRARALAQRAQVVRPWSAVRLLAPLPRPRRLRDALAFEKHVRQSKANRYLFGQGTARLDPATIEIPAAWYRKPVYYKGNIFSIVGPETTVRWPAYSQIVDYELEVAVVTWDSAVDVPVDQALDHVFGYMVFNDFSARDAQYVEMQTGLGPAKGKDFDTGNAMGPWLVTRDEVPDPQDLTMIARVNGEEWSRGSTSQMLHSFAAIVSFASEGETFYAGEILGSGTVGGGCGNEQGRFMKDGDVVELEVPGLGVLRNTISAPHVKSVPKLPINIFG
jgi:2-keto-4-pentenoate hydratase/2-oxohepta-3-ene-1,7-dioic acid hydratase in catechol pathway